MSAVKAFIIGTALGIGIGAFLQTGKRKRMRMKSELKLAARLLQKRLAKKAQSIKNLTRERYEDLVDQTIASYTAAQSITGSRIKRLKQTLMDKWEDIRLDLEKEDKYDDEDDEDEDEDEEDDEEEED